MEKGGCWKIIINGQKTPKKIQNKGFLGDSEWGSHSRHFLEPFLPNLDHFATFSVKNLVKM